MKLWLVKLARLKKLFSLISNAHSLSLDALSTYSKLHKSGVL